MSFTIRIFFIIGMRKEIFILTLKKCLKQFIYILLLQKILHFNLASEESM